jgi:hypothetical protein
MRKCVLDAIEQWRRTRYPSMASLAVATAIGVERARERSMGESGVEGELQDEEAIGFWIEIECRS